MRDLTPLGGLALTISALAGAATLVGTIDGTVGAIL